MVNLISTNIFGNIYTHNKNNFVMKYQGKSKLNYLYEEFYSS